MQKIKQESTGKVCITNKRNVDNEEWAKFLNDNNCPGSRTLLCAKDRDLNRIDAKYRRSFKNNDTSIFLSDT